MKVCFIGHRTIEDAEQIRQRVIDTVATLIEKGADTFLFGSRSDFDMICWEVVTNFQVNYPNVKRISYTAPHETSFTSKEERERFEQLAQRITKSEVHCADYEEVVASNNANKNAYIMRNQEMIDAADICVFYYNERYLPPLKKPTNSFIPSRQSQSGTAIAYTYAKQKKKEIINVYNN